MTTIELEASKAELVREILNIENSETIGKLRKYKYLNRYPHLLHQETCIHILCYPFTKQIGEG